MEIRLPVPTEQLRNGLQPAEEQRKAPLMTAFSWGRIQANQRLVSVSQRFVLMACGSLSDILPSGSRTTKLIVTGTNHTLANLSTRHWIPATREEIRQWENECNECCSKAAQQIMAPLPRVRQRFPLRAFVQVSVDYEL